MWKTGGSRAHTAVPSLSVDGGIVMRTIRARAATLLLAATVGLAGCGTDDAATDDGTASEGSATPSTGDADQAAAPDESSPDEQAAAPSQASTTDGDGSTADEAAGDAEGLLVSSVDATAATESMRTRVTSTSQTAQGEVTVEAESVSRGTDSRTTMLVRPVGAGAEGAGEATDTEMEVVLLDGVVYLRYPALAQQLAVDVEWLRFDLEEVGPEFADVLATVEDTDPMAKLSMLEEYADVEVVGTEDVRGVSTTHMVVDVVLRDALDAQGVDPGMLGADVDLDRVVQYELWVDDESRLWRMTSSMDVQGMPSSTTIDVLEYGVEVDIQPPPADVTLDFAEMLDGVDGGAGAGAGG